MDFECFVDGCGETTANLEDTINHFVLIHETNAIEFDGISTMELNVNFLKFEHQNEGLIYIPYLIQYKGLRFLLCVSLETRFECWMYKMQDEACVIEDDEKLEFNFTLNSANEMMSSKESDPTKQSIFPFTTAVSEIIAAGTGLSISLRAIEKNFIFKSTNSDMPAFMTLTINLETAQDFKEAENLGEKSPLPAPSVPQLEGAEDLSRDKLPKNILSFKCPKCGDSMSVVKRSMVSPQVVDQEELPTISIQVSDQEELPTISPQVADQEELPTISPQDADQEELSTISPQDADQEELSTISPQDADKEELSTISPQVEDEEELPTISLQVEDEEELSTISPQVEDEEQLPTISLQVEDEEQLPTISPQVEDEEQLPTISPQVEDEEQLPTISPQVEDEEQLPTISPQVEDEEQLPTISPQVEDEEELPTISPQGEDEEELPTISPQVEDEEQLPTISPQFEDEEQLPTISPQVEERPFLSYLNEEELNMLSFLTEAPVLYEKPEELIPSYRLANGERKEWLKNEIRMRCGCYMPETD